jgi:hypothetical protein
VDRVALSWEPKFLQTARRQFARDLKALMVVLDEQKSAKATIDWQTVGKGWQQAMIDAGDEWRQAFIPVVRGLVIDQGEQYNTEFGFEFDVRNLYSEEWLLDYTMPFAESVIDTTNDDLNVLLTQGMAEGWSIPQTQRHLQQIFEQYMRDNLLPEAFAWFAARMPAYRAEMIARTESIRASGRGSNSLYRAWGVEYKQWYATEDDRLCPFCAQLHEKIIPTGDNFFPKGGRMNVEVGEGEDRRTLTLNFGYEDVVSPPAHPLCRCVLLPWRPEWQ